MNLCCKYSLKNPRTKKEKKIWNNFKPASALSISPISSPSPFSCLSLQTPETSSLHVLPWCLVGPSTEQNPNLMKKEAKLSVCYLSLVQLGTWNQETYFAIWIVDESSYILCLNVSKHLVQSFYRPVPTMTCFMLKPEDVTAGRQAIPFFLSGLNLFND